MEAVIQGVRIEIGKVGGGGEIEETSYMFIFIEVLSIPAHDFPTNLPTSVLRQK